MSVEDVVFEHTKHYFGIVRCVAATCCSTRPDHNVAAIRYTVASYT